MIVEGLGILKAVLDLLAFRNARWAKLGGILAQPLLTGCILLVGYVGWQVAREGSFGTGLQVALFDTPSSIAVRDRNIQTAILQAELRQAATSDALVTQIMAELVRKTHRVARVRLAVIHNGITGLTGISLLRYDIINAVSAPGRAPGELVQNEPLTAWTALLPTLVHGDCIVRLVSEMPMSSGKDRLQRMGTEIVLACPVTDIRGQMLGALFVEWDSTDDVPKDTALADATALTRASGQQIALALDLRPDTH